MLKEDKENATNGKQKGQCSRGDKCSFRHDEDKRAKPTPKTAPPSEPPTQRGRRESRKKKLRGRGPPGKFARLPCEDFLKGICTKLLCDNRHPPECQFYLSESGCKFGNKRSFPRWKVEEQPHEKPKKGGDKNTVAFFEKLGDSWVVYFKTVSMMHH